MRARALLAASPLFAVACTLTLPLDEVSGGLPKPASHYGFEEQGGEFVADDVAGRAGALDGETSNPTFTGDGKRGRALEFGDDGYLYFASYSGTAFPKAASVAAWIRVRALPGAEDDPPEIFGAYDAGDRAPLLVTLTSRGTIVFSMVTASGARTELASDALEMNRWYLLAFGWDEHARTAFLSVKPESGSARAQTGAPPDGFSLGSLQLLLAPRKSTLDELRIWSRALAPAEVSMLTE